MGGRTNEPGPPVGGARKVGRTGGTAEEIGSGAAPGGTPGRSANMAGGDPASTGGAGAATGTGRPGMRGRGVICCGDPNCCGWGRTGSGPRPGRGAVSGAMPGRPTGATKPGCGVKGPIGRGAMPMPGAIMPTPGPPGGTPPSPPPGNVGPPGRADAGPMPGGTNTGPPNGRGGPCMPKLSVCERGTGEYDNARVHRA